MSAISMYRPLEINYLLWFMANNHALSQEDVSNKEILTLLQQHIAEQNKRFENTEERFDKIDQRFDSIDQRLDGHDQKFISINQRFENIDQRFEQQTQDIIAAFQGFANNTEERFQYLESTMNNVVKILNDVRTDQQSMLVLYDQNSSKLNNHEIRIVKLENAYSAA